MARKTVNLSVRHPIPIGSVDVVFAVYDGTKHYGDVTISQGGIDWRPSYGRKAFKKDWPAFDAVMRAEG